MIYVYLAGSKYICQIIYLNNQTPHAPVFTRFGHQPLKPLHLLIQCTLTTFTAHAPRRSPNAIAGQ